MQKGGCDSRDGQLASGFAPRKGDNQPKVSVDFGWAANPNPTGEGAA